jgi:hypothetical protein
VLSTIDCNHFEIVTESLTGGRSVDEETFSSVAVLAERLDRLKKTSSVFSNVSFSPELEELAEREMISAIS